MQEIQGIGGRSELIGDDAGDWTMKQSQQNLNRQLLKCPRCDSINTKFCYYNNYNLSQPRHFCKSCRRYWTKGGVLRSVPVGGGCRKTKRSKPKHSSETPESVIIKRNSDSHSNSDCESSSLTAITVAKAAETFFAPTLTSPSNLIRAPEWYPFSSQTQNSPLQSAQLLEKSSDSELFSYNGSFSEGFPIGCSNFSGVTPFQLSSQGPHRDQNDHQSQHNLWNPWSFIEIGDEDEASMPEIRAGFLDQTVEADLPPLQSRPNMEFGSFNHLEIGRLDFIDIPGSIEGNYWNDPLGSLPPERKASSSFTRRGSVVYTKTPSRDSLSRRIDPKGRIIAQSIPTNKKREHGEKDQGKSVNPSDADSFSLFSAKSFSSEKEKEELVLLREQLEDLQKHLLEKDELLKSAENTKRQMTTISAKLDALKVQSAEKDAIMKSAHSQLSETKIKLADRQAALEKIQWEAMTSNRKVAKLEEELKTMHGDISSFMLLLESLAKNNSDVLVNDYDFAVCQLENDPSIDNLDDMEIEKIEEATKAYIAALAVAKEKQDEESIAAATTARLHLQSFVLGNNISDVH